MSGVIWVLVKSIEDTLRLRQELEAISVLYVLLKLRSLEMSIHMVVTSD